MRLIVILAALLGMADAARTVPPGPSSRVDAAQPPAFFWRSACGYCHDREPFAPALLGRHAAVELTTHVVRTGAPGMPPFHASEISDSELEDLARWIAASKPSRERQ